ncbi:urease accessory protein [Methylomagnum ishizawai]|uniref:Urease accessory protein UreD n=1 Tax=Methylomagnum ishizawai TaxID=1760988 RepID=A0A1Y6D4J7_9GAMM|nr:urease accessory protein UreD [Methylomagnum ishizawai]SMF95462.1 urease accessory protein [Methylomagnum ishizawai]
MSAVPATEAAAPEGWRAGLELGFAATGSGKTLLARRRHHGPLAVQRPFHPEGGVCHVYVLHPPGGVVAGDRLSIRVEADPGAAALVTTPAAGKFYRSAGPLARQSVALTIAPGAALEWLPQETIVYQGARVASTTRVDLREGARFLGWEVLALGRPAAGEGFEAGEAGLDWRIDLEGQPLYLERLVLDPWAFRAHWGLRGRAALGTLFAYPATAAQLDTVRGLVGDRPDLGVSLIEGLLICRGLDARADVLRRFFEQVWAALRPGVMGRPACPPRIWAT